MMKEIYQKTKKKIQKYQIYNLFTVYDGDETIWNG